MRICILYDCLFPWTIGGAERWYRALAEKLAAEGHQVTYLTLRQWADDDAPALQGVRVVAVGPKLSLYRDGKRRLWPPLRYGLGVFWHLMRHGRNYDHVHGASFPFFSLLAAGLLRRLHGYSIGVDWHEVWTAKYWREYLGLAGVLGWWVQYLCTKVQQKAFAFSHLHGNRLQALGRDWTHLPGEYAGGTQPRLRPASPPTLVYAGRLIPEKRVPLLIEAFAITLQECPDLRLKIFGKGPERDRVAATIGALGLQDRVELSGFVEQAELDRAVGEATAIVQPSAREGYGMVVVEASARGVPTIVVQAPDNAAVELVTPGQNGLVADPGAAALAQTIITVCRDGDGFRERTARWYAANERRLSLDHSLEKVISKIAN